VARGAEHGCVIFFFCNFSVNLSTFP
jgi:hypothetical protein